MSTIDHSARVSRIAVSLVLWSGLGLASAQTLDDFFNPATLHEIRLTMSRRDWQTLKDRFELDTYYAADVRWNGITLRNVGVRSRGHITRNGVKPGLRIDVNRYLSDQRLLGLTAFSLDNAYYDPSLIRESIAMKLFNRVGIAAPRETHARVFVNEEYAGVYVILEAIDRAFVDRTFGEDEAHVEHGGYLFEYRWMRPYGFEYLGPGLEAYAELFTPQTRETDSMSGLFGPLEKTIRAITDTTDDQFPTVVNGFLDLRLFMRYLAVENFLADTDGLVGQWGLHNFYLYRRRNGQSSFIPWDKDETFTAVDHPVDYHLDQNVLTRRAMAVPALRQIYLETLLECAISAQEQDPAAPDAPGWLEREIERTAERIRADLSEDPVYPYSRDQFQSEVERLRRFARERPLAVMCAVTGFVNTAEGPQRCAWPPARGVD